MVGFVGRWANCLVAGGVVSRFLSGPGTRPLPLFGDLAEPSLTAGEGELVSGHGAGKNQDKRWVVLLRCSGTRGGRFPCVCRVPGVLAAAEAGSKVSAFRFENHEKPKKNRKKNHKKTQKKPETGSAGPPGPDLDPTRHRPRHPPVKLWQYRALHHLA